MYIYIAIGATIFWCILRKNKNMSGKSESSESTSWSWSNYSPTVLKSLEKEILSYVKTPYTGKNVHIGSVVGSDDKIWTIALNQSANKTPLVLLHGMGAGVGFWVMNLDALAVDRPVYAFDLLGFGSSSRPQFSSDPKEIEMQMVNAVEEWRKIMKLDKFVLVGHSLGAFISTLYAMEYPKRVQHLVLADSWGLPECPEDISTYYKIPRWAKYVGFILKHLNPLWGIRAAGPWGPNVVLRVRKDIVEKFRNTISNPEVLIPKYVHQCNSQTPTGEAAFHRMMKNFAFAKNPLVPRINLLDASVPMTLLFGSKSWVKRDAADMIVSQRPNSYVHVEVITGGHHINLDSPSDFNCYVFNACQLNEVNSQGM